MATTIFKKQNLKIKYDRTLNERIVFTKTYQLLWFFGGSGTLDFQTSKVDVKADSLFLIPVNTTYSIIPNELLSHVNINIPIDLMPLNDIPKHRLIDIDSQLIKQSFATYLYNYRKQTDFDIDEASKNLIGIIINNSTSSNIAVNHVSDDRILECLGYIENNYTMRFNVSDIAQLLHINPTYLSTVFKKEVGTSIVKYTNARRLSNAFLQLQTTNKSITRIAFENGFADVRTFNELSKERHGYTPKMLREQIAQIDKEGRDEFGDYTQIIEKYKIVNQQRQSKTIDLDINLNAQTDTFNNKFNTFAIGRAHDILYAHIQGQIIKAKQDLDLKYCRFHNIFGDEMNIIDNDFNGNQMLSFVKPLAVIDFLINNQITPIIELGFFPEQVACGTPSPFSGYNVNLGGDIDFDLWEQIVTTFVSLLKELYPKQFHDFRFDFWNEPDIKGFWPGSDEDFIKLYKITYDAIKNIDANALFGGLGFANFSSGSLEIGKFISKLDQIGRIPDFISLHSYPLHLDLSNLTLDDITAVSEIKYVENKFNLDLDKARELKAQFNLREVHISEWNTSPIQREYLNDSTYKSSKLINTMLKANTSDISNICYWTLSDEMVEFGYPESEIHGGFGLMTRSGINKPAYYAMNFINNTKETIIHRDNNSLISKDDEHIVILINNEVGYSRDYNYSIGNDNAELMLGHELTYNIKLGNIANGAYKVEYQKITVDNDLNTLKSTLGENASYLSKDKIAIYNDFTKPQKSTAIINLEDTHTLNLSLLPTETMIVHLTKL